MKNISFLIFCASLLFAGLAQAEKTGSLQIKFHLNTPLTGVLYMQVISEEGRGEFPDNDSEISDRGIVFEQISSFKTPQQNWQAPSISLPEGRYAVAAWFDLNGDGVLNRNLVRAPREPYGFSNNARGGFGPPSFEKAAFSLEAGRTTVLDINLFKHFADAPAGE